MEDLNPAVTLAGKLLGDTAVHQHHLNICTPALGWAYEYPAVLAVIDGHHCTGIKDKEVTILQ